MHTQLLPAPHQPSLAVLALLLLSGTDLFGTGAPLAVPVLPLPGVEDIPPITPAAAEPERLAA
ncbi:hypothetical protein DNI29_22095 [Hymenobacter sediminis]|uniref:hypothetical protein n=1 Tax=Hymenobacter sediminis TaxID=2218621 RepID=UPI000F4D5638|nr:hypothetical protein [Hymenobacter sediminis]RPD44093.1 hypothetical protein DNI29_22095 [Hymenobacter sediminis]